ncbi:Zn-ribbon domain-containing OB-fold protein [soil metagenome]
MKAAIPTSQAFIDGLVAHRLMVQRCTDCGRAQHLSKLLCRWCGGRSLAWQEAAGTAVLVAASKVWRAPSQDFRALVPYTLVIAELDEGARVMAHADDGLTVGARVRAGYFEHEGRTLLRFTADPSPIP